MAPSSPSLPQAMEIDESINWTELPPELTSSILLRLGPIEILENAQKVCRSWRRVCKDPSMWRRIDMGNRGDSEYDLDVMCRHAVERSQGGLISIDIWRFGTDSLLEFIAERSSNLRSLKLAMCEPVTDEGFVQVVDKFPLLEDLELSYCQLSEVAVRVAGQSCPNLKTFKLNCVGYTRPSNESDEDAIAIAATMPRLRHLQLFGNKLTDTGLNAVLDQCPDLEHLDLRQCFNVNLTGDLEKRCFDKIKVVKRPNDSTRDYPYDATVEYMDSSEDDYPDGFSDIDLVTGEEDYYDYSASDHSDYDQYDF